MTTINALQFASRFNAPAATPAEYLEECLARAHWPTHVIGMGEVYAKHMPDLRDLLNPLGFRVTLTDEYLTAWDREALGPRGTLAQSGSIRRMSNVYAGRDRWRDPDMATRRLRVRATGEPVNIDVLHAPSGIEYGSSFRPGPQAQAWKQTYDAAGKLIARRRPEVTTLLLHDSNANHRDPRWRGEVEARTGLHSMWSTGIPIVGTHRNWGAKTGSRCTDGINTNGQVEAGHAMPWPGGRRHLDHRATAASVKLVPQR